MKKAAASFGATAFKSPFIVFRGFVVGVVFSAPSHTSAATIPPANIRQGDFKRRGVITRTICNRRRTARQYELRRRTGIIRRR